MILTNKCTVISSKKKDVLNHKCRSMSNCGTKKTPVFSNFLLLEGTIYGRGGTIHRILQYCICFSG